MACGYGEIASSVVSRVLSRRPVIFSGRARLSRGVQRERGGIIWMTTICRRCSNGNAAYVRSEYFLGVTNHYLFLSLSLHDIFCIFYIFFILNFPRTSIVLVSFVKESFFKNVFSR